MQRVSKSNISHSIKYLHKIYKKNTTILFMINSLQISQNPPILLIIIKVEEQNKKYTQKTISCILKYLKATKKQIKVDFFLL